MKKYLIHIILALTPVVLLAQTTTENYVQTTSYQKAVQESELGYTLSPTIQQISYFDGLGRPTQNIAVAAGGAGEDHIVPSVYDGFGRQTKSYLPYTRSTSSLSYAAPTQLLTDLNQQYLTNYTGEFDVANPNPYSETKLESSPLNRALSQAAPGQDWSMTSGHTIKTEYLSNTDTEVRLFTVTHPSGAESIALNWDVNNGFYPKDELRKTVVKDENWTSGKAHTTEEFINKSGQVLLKRTYAVIGGSDVAHDTYYVYDNYGNLTYVLSPEASDSVIDTNNTIDTVVLDNLGYQYKYDYRNRLIEKKIPGKGWESIVYDILDRPVLTQDPNLQAQGKWLFTKYDALGRVVYTGMYTDSQTRAQLQTTVGALTTVHETKSSTALNISSVDVYYTNTIFPTSTAAMEILTVNYYDDYNFNSPLVLEASHATEDYIRTQLVAGTGRITRNDPGSGWNAGFQTTESIVGDGFIEWTVLDDDKRLMMGLSKSSNLDTTYYYGTIDYAVSTGYDNLIRIHENGPGIGTGTTYVEGDRLRIERQGENIYYKKNGETFYQSLVTTTDELWGDSSFLHHEATIENVTIGHVVYGQDVSDKTKGLATGSVVRVLGTNDVITTVTQYDEKGRAIYMASDNPYLQTNDVVKTQYDFVGNVMETSTSHIKGTSSPVVTVDVFTYDHQNRLLRQTQTINSESPEVIVDNTYDALGQLVVKKTGLITDNISTNTTNHYRTSREGNVIAKEVTDSWDGNFETTERLTGDGYVEFTITETGKYSMIGLSDPDDTLDNFYATIDYAIYTGAGSMGIAVYIYEEGTAQPMPYTVFTYGDTFKIERIGTQVKYYKNGVEIWTSTNASTTDLIGDACLLSRGEYVENFKLVNLNTQAGQTLQDVDYAYNVRGWLKQINDPSQSLTSDLFAFKMNYNTTETGLGAAALYNGNISETIWKTVNDDVQRSYAYQYDALNRIKNGTYAAGSNEQNFYNLNSIAYDKNGNILSLNRNGQNASAAATTIDNLVYGYAANSNQLMRVTDNALNTEGFNDQYVNNAGDPNDNDYLYDANGNMILDKNKHITAIDYNHLNLPTKVTFANQSGASNDNTIDYVYDATGIKLEKIVKSYSGFNDVNTYGTQYAGNYVYKGTVAGSSTPPTTYDLEFFNHAEGYVEPYSAGKGGILHRYVYQHKDHLGNIRVSYSDYDNDGTVDILRDGVDVDGDSDLASEIVQTKDYYPFGLQIKHGASSQMSVVNGRNHKYGYNGMEREDSFGFNMDEMDMRFYDVAIGRWQVLDPVIHHSFSTYSAFDNNPIFWADPSGADSVAYGMVTSNSGAIVWGGVDSGQFDDKEDCPSCPDDGGIPEHIVDMINTLLPLDYYESAYANTTLLTPVNLNYSHSGASVKGIMDAFYNRLIDYYENYTFEVSLDYLVSFGGQGGGLVSGLGGQYIDMASIVLLEGTIAEHISNSHKIEHKDYYNHFTREDGSNIRMKQELDLGYNIFSGKVGRRFETHQYGRKMYNEDIELEAGLTAPLVLSTSESVFTNKNKGGVNKDIKAEASLKGGMFLGIEVNFKIGLVRKND